MSRARTAASPRAGDPDEEHGQIVAFRANPDLIDALDKIAHESFRSRSFVIRRLLAKGLGIALVESGVQLDVIATDSASRVHP